MVKIIGSVVPLENMVYKETCENCGTIFEFQEEDVKYTFWGSDEYVKCPRCRKRVYLSYLTRLIGRQLKEGEKL